MKIAVKIALLITVETARGMHTALPRVLDALHAAQASIPPATTSAAQDDALKKAKIELAMR